MDREKIRKIVSKHRHEKAAIFAILHELQEEDKQLDMDSLKYTAQLLKVSFANVYGLATFYSAFSTSKKGETEIRVCDGISCHMKGSGEVTEALKSFLKLQIGETTWNEKYSLEEVHCLGLCSIGPNASFNTKVYPRLNKEHILNIIKEKIGDSK